MRQIHFVAAFALIAVAGCGGGGSSVSDAALPPAAINAPGPAGSTPAPVHPGATPTPTATPTPAPVYTFAPGSAGISRIPSTVGRIGLVQVFDYSGGRMSASTVQHYAPRYDAVWGSTEPEVWRSAHSAMDISLYAIMGLDRNELTHRSLSWWQSNHPTWILYACKSDGTPTHDIAYMPGINDGDMPIDIHNPDAVRDQITTLAHAATAAGYNSLAIDQVVFWNTLVGGNPSFGQHKNASEFACGVWQGSTFVRRYARVSDEAWNADVVSYVGEARSVLHGMGMPLIVNHPAGNVNDSYEQALLRNTDIIMDETGFSDYGRYKQKNGLFQETLAYMQYAQHVGAAVLMVDKFANLTHVDSEGFEYSLATYLLGNEGEALLFVGGVNDYGTEQYHNEYDAAIGAPCGETTSNGALYTRRFKGAVVVVNSGASTQSFTLPSPSFTDIERRGVRSTMQIGPNDAYILMGKGC